MQTLTAPMTQHWLIVASLLLFALGVVPGECAGSARALAAKTKAPAPSTAHAPAPRANDEQIVLGLAAVQEANKALQAALGQQAARRAELIELVKRQEQ